MFLPLFLLIVGKSERIYSTGFQHFRTEKTAAKTGFLLKSVHASGCSFFVLFCRFIKICVFKRLAVF
jgi:hypothetical protein